MWAEPTKVARASASDSLPHADSSSLPRIEYSSSEPCALTAYGAPAAAATGPPRRTWLAKTRSAGSSARTAAALMNERFVNVDRKSTRLNSSHVENSYAVFCLKKKKDKN